MKKVVRIFAALGLMASMSACALQEDIVDVNYAPISEEMSIGADGKSFALLVEDARGKYKGRIGNKVNGFGQEMAEIKSTVPVQEIVNKAFTDELKARKLVIEPTVMRNVKVTITALHNQFKVGFASGEAHGITSFRIAVLRDDEVLFEEVVSEVHVEEGIMIASGENAAKAIEASLVKAMKSLFSNDDFLAALVEA